MDEFFDVEVDAHIAKLQSILVTLNRIGSYQFDQIDGLRMGDAKRELKHEIARFEHAVVAARLAEVAA